MDSIMCSRNKRVTVQIHRMNKDDQIGIKYHKSRHVVFFVVKGMVVFRKPDIAETVLMDKSAHVYVAVNESYYLKALEEASVVEMAIGYYRYDDEYEARKVAKQTTVPFYRHY